MSKLNRGIMLIAAVYWFASPSVVTVLPQRKIEF